MSLKGLQLRTATIHQLRQQLQAHGYAELVPPLFSRLDTNEPTLYPHKVGDYYLPTSPEAFLKQAIAAGQTNCFAISHAFRNLEGEGRLHAHEFIMAEWYSRDTTLFDQISFTQRLVAALLPPTPPQWPTVSWKQLWHQHLQLDLDDLIPHQHMTKYAKKIDINTQNATWEQLFNQIADIFIVPHFPHQPFFLIDYPAKISPLAKPDTNQPLYAERFELFIQGIEIANGNTENVDIDSIKPILTSESRRRHQPAPTGFLDSLAALSGQSWSGVGLGIDRLAMLIGGHTSINQVNSL